ncbi:SHOCT domain-containing protein [Luminiphilus sp.]|nr:SHOCT domain-containing protein [Luminiphilus sp.]
MNKSFKSNPETVYEAVRKVIADSGYTVLNSSRDDFTISFNTGRSMSSWNGQDLTVSLFPDGDDTNVVIGGRLAKGGTALTGGGSQLFAWGEKDKLSKAFLENIEKILPSIPTVSSSADQATGQSGSVAEEIKKLLTLREAGVLSDSEFEAAKTKLLND